MAKAVWNPLGQWFGRVGGVIYKIVGGKQIIYAYTKSESKEDKPTIDQLIQRHKFAFTSKLASLFPDEAIVGLPGSRYERRNVLFNNIMKAAFADVDTDNIITVSLKENVLMLSSGPLAACSVTAGISRTSVSGYVRPDDPFVDMALLVALCRSGQEYVAVNTKYVLMSVADVAFSIPIPEGTSHVDLYCVPIRLNERGYRILAQSYYAMLGSGKYEYVYPISVSPSTVRRYYESFLAQQLDNGETYYTIKVTHSGNGTTSGSGTYLAGTAVKIKATPDSGWRFVRWTDGYDQPTRTVIVNASMSFAAIFAQNEEQLVTISTSAYPAGAGTVSGAGTYPVGTQVMLFASANTGYSFDHWDDGSSERLINPRYVLAAANTTYGAVFVAQPSQSYRVYVTSEHGSVSGVTSGNAYQQGTQLTLSWKSDETPYEFVGWMFRRYGSSDAFADLSSANPLSYTVQNYDVEIKAVSQVPANIYQVIVYPIPADLDDSLYQVTGAGYYNAGTVANVKLVKYDTDRLHFLGWKLKAKGDIVSTDLEINYPVNSDTKIYVVFEKL